MFEILGEAGKQEILETNASKILDLKSSSEQIFSRKLPLGAPAYWIEIALVKPKTRNGQDADACSSSKIKEVNAN